jgi:hypothetical protein
MSNTAMTQRLSVQRGKSFLAIFVQQVLLVSTTPPKYYDHCCCPQKM